MEQPIENGREGYVYALYHVDRPEVVEYVGQTVSSLEERRKGHIYDALHRNRRNTVPVQNFIRKYGAECLGIRLLETCYGHDMLNEREIELIAHYRGLGQARLNVRDGGNSSAVAEATKQKLRDLLSGEGSANTSLTWGKVRKARDMYVLGVELEEIRSFLEVSPRQLNRILRNNHWVDLNYIPPTRRSNAVLSEEVVREIRAHALESHTPREELAQLYGVSRVLIVKVLSNKLWFDPDYDPALLPKRDYSAGKPTSRPSLSREEVERIRAMYGQGESIRQIHQKLHPELSEATIRNVVKRKGAYSD